LLTFVSPSEEKEMKDYFSNRFGIPGDTFKAMRLLRSGRTIWLVADVLGLDAAFRSLKIEASGVPLLRIRESMVKPTTSALQLFGQRATRNAVDLDDEALETFLEAGTVSKTYPVEPGYVILRWKGKVLGCGLYGRGKLRSQIPLTTWSNMKGRPESAEP